MGNRVAEFLIAFSGDDSDLVKVFSKIKSTAADAASEIQKTTDKVDLFRTIQDNLPKVTQALESAKAKVAEYAAAIEKAQASGARAPKELVDGLKQAERAVADATREVNRQQRELDSLGATLSRAGVNTKNLAAEQGRLAQAQRNAAAAAAEQAAKQQLGLVTVKDTAVEAGRLQAAFDTLKKSGTLSATETAAAQKLLDARLKELGQTVNATGQTFKTLHAESSAAFAPVTAGVAATAAALGGLVAAYQGVIAVTREYQQNVAQVGAVTTLSRDQLSGLAREVRGLAADLGLDVNEALKKTIDLLRSGVPRDNVIDALRASAEASKAAVTSLGDGTKAADVLISGFKVSVADLPRAFDAVIAGAKNGGVTLTEFANTIGPVAQVAQAANIPLNEVVATLAVMVNNGIDAGNAADSLGKIIQKLGSNEVRGRLNELGVSARGLVGVFTELGAKGKGLDDVLALGIGNPKNAAAIAALTNNAGDLQAKLDAVTKSAGATKSALDLLKDTPKERIERFNAALEETKIKLGETVGTGGLATAVLTQLLVGFNKLPPEIIETSVNTGQFTSLLIASIAAAKGWLPVAEQTAKSYAPIKTAAQLAAEQLAEITKKLDAQKKAAEEGLSKLTERTTALQKAAQDELAAINDRVDAEIAALDRSTAANVANAAKIAEIQKTAAAERLKVAQDSEEAIRKATAEAINTRITLLREQGGANVERDIQQARQQLIVAANTQILSSYKGLYADLKSQAQASATTINQIDAQRVTFNEGVAASLRTIRLSQLSDLQQYSERAQEVDRLITKGREIAATEGIAAAQKYFDQAKTLSEGVTKVVNEDGVEVISTFEAQQKKIELLKRVSAAYNEELSNAKDRAKEGAAGTEEALEQVRVKIEQVSKETTQLQQQLADGLAVRVNKDIIGLEEARQKIDELVRERTVRVRVVGPGETTPTPVSPESGVPLARGGFVPGFAGGGTVFARPNYIKVPGVGSGDTVPALLTEGSFVVRKAASKYYGDDFMSKVVRGYADGGTVGGASIPDVLGYARYILQYIRLHPFFAGVRDVIGQEVRTLEQRDHLNDTGLAAKLLQDVRSVALNFSIKDFFGRTVSGDAVPRAGASNLPDFDAYLARRPKVKTFAEGGRAAGTDTVPAMLTPGEFIISAPRARALGADFLHDLNNMQLGPMRIPRFATGGLVPGADIPARGAVSSVPGTVNVTINAAGGNLEDPRVIRKITDGIREQMRRAGQTL